MKWGLHWTMDGMQWEVLSIDMYEPSMYNDFCVAKEVTYTKCIFFIYFHLYVYRSDKCKVHMHCPEGTFILQEADIIYVMNRHYPELMI